MATQYSKVKSPPKSVTTVRNGLNQMVLNTMATISEIVGSTLGPGGKVVIIERQEIGMPNIITKDGVTVFKSLGFSNPTQHAIMEAARDGAAKTAHDAGDGTTTCAILSESIVRNVQEFCIKNPKVSPQKAVRTLERLFKTSIEPLVRKQAFKVAKDTQYSIAKVSANGDSELADAVIKCFELVGDDGNVTISEISGESEYKVEKIEGFPIPRGYEDTMGKFYHEYINDSTNQRVLLERPFFVLYFGVINDIQSIVGLAQILEHKWQIHNKSPNVVMVATGFSENVIANLATNFKAPNGLKIVPVVAPLSQMPNGQLDFLEDLSAITGAVVFNPISEPLPGLLPEQEIEEFDECIFGGGDVSMFEMYRNKSTIIGKCDEELVLARVDVLKTQAKSASSQLDKSIIEERIGKITGGIARLIVSGSSSGEIREKKDRAEDAVRAVQGALSHGCLPAGGWTLAKITTELPKIKDLNDQDKDIVNKILVPSLLEPIRRLYSNIGLNNEEVDANIRTLTGNASNQTSKTASIYDCMANEWVNAKDAGLLDSTPAVLEAVRNSLSIASQLVTLGGCVVYHRDAELERQEAREALSFERSSNTSLED